MPFLTLRYGIFFEGVDDLKFSFWSSRALIMDLLIVEKGDLGGGFFSDSMSFIAVFVIFLC